MSTYYTYNFLAKRIEIVIDDILVMSLDHEQDETGHAYLMYNGDNNQLEYYVGGILVRSYE